MNLNNSVLNFLLFSSTVQNVLSVENFLSFKIMTLPPFERCRAKDPTTRYSLPHSETLTNPSPPANLILCGRDTRPAGMELLQA